MQIPALRAFGFVVLCVVAAIGSSSTATTPLWAIWALNLGYAAATCWRFAPFETTCC